MKQNLNKTMTIVNRLSRKWFFKLHKYMDGVNFKDLNLLDTVQHLSILPIRQNMNMVFTKYMIDCAIILDDIRLLYWFRKNRTEQCTSKGVEYAD